MKKTTGNGNDLMRINGNPDTGNGGARPPLMGINEELYQEDLYTDYSVEKPVIGPDESSYTDYSAEEAYTGRRRKKGLTKMQLLMITGIVVLGIVAVVCGVLLFNSFNEEGGGGSVKTDVLIEAGTPITLDLFFEKTPANAVFLTDISGIDVTQPAAYQLKIGYGSNEADVVLRIEDHTGPTGEAVPVTVYLNWKMPEPKECVTNLYDLSGIAKVAYQEGTPKFTAGGSYQVPVIVTDVYGNSTVIQVPFTIIDDHTPPVIKGTHDFVLDGNPDQLDFYKGITVTDDYDKEPVVKVDDSGVDYTKAGTYDLVYRAIDKAGNIGTAKAKITINIPTEEITNTTPASSGDNGTYHVGDGDPYALASKVLSQIQKGNDVDTARAIFNWVHDTFWFRLLSGTPDYEDAAYRGFTLHNGDCYVYYACCKMLLDAAGIPNMRVDRSPARNGNIHFWLLVQLNGEWYHCDATEGYNDHPGIWFMCTDDEINDQYHQFNGSLYPARAGGSKEFKTTATPTPTPTPTLTPSPTPTPGPSQTITPTPTGTVTPTGDVSPTPTTEPEGSSPTPTVAEITQTPETTPSETTPVPPPTTPSEDTPAPTTPSEEPTAPEVPENTEPHIELPAGT